jgi:hypothetical protein
VQAIGLLTVVAFARGVFANGADLPPEILLQGFVKAEDRSVRVLLRVPLVLLSSFSLPKRGIGYLDLANIDDKLKQAATAAGQQIELTEDGRRLEPTVRAYRISLLSDRSFASYATALADLHGPPLPADTDLFWNQGFFDTELEYTRRASDSDLAIRVNVAPEVGQRLKVRLEFLPATGASTNLEFSGSTEWTPLNPRWYQAAWLLLKHGFLYVFALDRFVFLLCLIAPFRQFRSLLALVLVAAGLQALTLTTAAKAGLGENLWLPPLFDTSLAVAVVLLAIGNLGLPSLRRRWFFAAVIGALGGFGLARVFEATAQFGGGHTIVSIVAFNVGVIAGEVASLIIAFVALRLVLDRVLGALVGVIVLSAVVAHMGWHSMIDNAQELAHQLGHAREAGLPLSSLAVVGLWLLPAFLVSVGAMFLPRTVGGTPVPTLGSAFRSRDMF